MAKASTAPHDERDSQILRALSRGETIQVDGVGELVRLLLQDASLASGVLRVSVEAREGMSEPASPGLMKCAPCPEGSSLAPKQTHEHVATSACVWDPDALKLASDDVGTFFSCYCLEHERVERRVAKSRELARPDSPSSSAPPPTGWKEWDRLTSFYGKPIAIGHGHAAFYDVHLSTLYVLKMGIDAIIEMQRGVKSVEGFHFDEDSETEEVVWCCCSERHASTSDEEDDRAPCEGRGLKEPAPCGCVCCRGE